MKGCDVPDVSVMVDECRLRLSVGRLGWRILDVPALFGKHVGDGLRVWDIDECCCARCIREGCVSAFDDNDAVTDAKLGMKAVVAKIVLFEDMCAEGVCQVKEILIGCKEVGPDHPLSVSDIWN
ncbi:MAG: hypothetical protein RL169_1520 [Armatimonadota bacterium]